MKMLQLQSENDHKTAELANYLAQILNKDVNPFYSKINIK